jgi:hypothetical protein
MSNLLYERRDQQFTVTVYDTDGTTVIPASTYLNAQYRIFPKTGCTALLSKSLGSGITVSGDNFVVSIDDTDIDFNGEYRHVFVVGTTVDELLPSVIDSFVTIAPGCEIV